MASEEMAAPVPIKELIQIAADYDRAGKPRLAYRTLMHVLKVAPQQPDALHIAGLSAFRLGHEQQALALISRAVRVGPDTALYLRNLCEIYRSLGRMDEALQAAQRAAALSPNDPLCLHNQSIIHYHRLELDEALACARQALLIAPRMAGAHFGCAETLLLRGEWAQGWEEYEWRFRIGGAAPLIPADQVRYGIPQWDGNALPESARLLLIADQGFGDVIQFSRYIGWARERCPDIVLAGSAEVVPVLQQIAPGLPIFSRWTDLPTYAAYAALSGLPRLHGTRLDNVPAAIPYLHADPARVAVWRRRLDQLVPRHFRRIGIVWAGRPTHNNDRNRSASLDTFAPLAELPGIALLTLQKGRKIDQAGRYRGRAPLINLGSEIDSYEDTMAMLEVLDLLVTVDTSVAHLAGAMGRPVWVMLPRAPDWRWLLERSDTPWYPTLRLFRQRTVRDWTDVMGDIVQALTVERFVGGRELTVPQRDTTGPRREGAL
jgi:tetratricopeptide (TPR) repeat protein